MNMTRSTEPPVRRRGEASANGRIGLIKENEEMCGFALIIMNSIIKYKNQSYCTKCEKHDKKQKSNLIAIYIYVMYISIFLMFGEENSLLLFL